MEQTHDGEVVDKETEKASDMEPAIRLAMRARVGHFKDQADSLTLEGVRRLLEKDLKLDKFALDVHKRFIKQCLEECFDGPDDENSKTLGENVEEVVHSDEQNTTRSLEGLQLKKEAVPNSKDEKEGSPVLGLLREEKQHEEDSQSAELDKVPSEGTIKKAIKKRAAYFRANSEKVTLVGVRRLLEEDLGLDKYALDSYKKFISDQLDEVLHSPEVAQSSNGIKKKPQKKNSLSQVSKKVSRSRSSDSSDSEDEEVEDDNIKRKKQITPKGKSGNSEVVKSRKRPASEIKSTSNKRKKPVEPTSEESSDEKDGNLSENGQSHSSADEPIKKKKEVSAHAYGKQVEHLKSIIKACGMSITPSVYKKVKQAPENKRESYLIKELENILGREGLSTNPSEKEIKTVKKKKEREKELEGIDMSNIVSSSRRRSTTTYIAPSKPKIPVQRDDDDGKKNDDDDDDTDDDEDDDDEDDSSSGGTSEGLDEDVEDED